MDIFDLAARISLDSSEYENGVESASSKAANFSSAWKMAGKVAAAGFAAITTTAVATAGAISSAVSNTAQYADNIDKSSQKLGVSAQFYQEWEAVLQHSGTSMDSMTATFKQLANATQETTESQSEAFQKLGISVDDLKSMSTEEVFSTVISGLQKMEEGTERTAIATQLLGRGAMEMGALLNTSAEDTQKMIDNVHALGGVMGDEAVKAGAQFQDSLQDLKTSISGAKNAISSEFLPSMSNVMDRLSALVSGVANGSTDIDTLVSNFVNSVSEAADSIMPKLEIVIDGISSLVTELAPKIAERLPEVAAKIVPDLLDAAADTIEALLAGVVSILPGFTKNVVDVLIKIVEMISDHADEFTQAAVDIVLTLVDGITNAVPKLIPAVVTIVKEISYTLIDNADKLLDAAFALIMALVDGIADNLPELVEAILMLCGKIIETFMNYDWSGQTEKLFQSVGNALTGAFSVALGAIDSLFGTHLSSWYNECKTFFFNLGVDMANALNPQAPDDREGKDISMDFRYAVNDETKRLIKAGMDAVEALKEAEKNVADSMGEAAYNSYLAYRKATEEDAKAMAEAVASEASNAAKKISTPIIDYGAQNAQAAKEAAKSVNEASLTVGDAIEESCETVTAAIDKEADKTVKATQNSTGKKLTALEKTMQSLDHMYKTHQISEEEYWEKKESAAKKYVDKDSEAWWSAMEAVTKHYDEVAQKRIEETKKNFNKYMNSFSDIATEYKKKFDDLSKTISNYSSSLTGGLYSGFNKDENGKITGYTKLAEKKHKLQDYLRLLQNLKKNGLSGPLLSMFQGLSLDEGMELAKYLSGLSGSNFNDIINSWNEINNIATEIGNLLYSEQAQAIAGEMQKALTEAVGEGQFSSIGENIVNSICEGMTGEVSTSKMQAALNKLSKNVTASTKLGNASIEMYSGSLKSGGITVNQTFVSPTELTQDEAGRKAKEGVMLAATR